MASWASATGIVAMATLTLSRDLVHAAGIVNRTAILLSLAMLWREHRHVLWRVVARITPSMLVGVAIGLAALAGLDRALMVRVLGITVVAIAGWNLIAPQLRSRESVPLDIGVGLLTGLLSGAFNTPGPPLAILLYRRPERPVALIVTMQAIFVCAAAVRATLSTGQGLITAAIAQEALIAAPFVVAGALLGTATARRIAPERFRRVAWLALGALGLVLLVAP